MKKNIYLFSVDLEDVRLRMENGTSYRERVPEMCSRYINFLEKHNLKITFFVVGEVAKAYPELIREIQRQGHEVACHSHKHLSLDKHSPSEFKTDLIENIKALTDAGVENITGYRAPFFSLTEKQNGYMKYLRNLGSHIHLQYARLKAHYITGLNSGRKLKK
jgi:peptidoglycan/xylan/chitin deacetylase (PgdA/CDA1 family)